MQRLRYHHFVASECILNRFNIVHVPFQNREMLVFDLDGFWPALMSVYGLLLICKQAVFGRHGTTAYDYPAS